MARVWFSGLETGDKSELSGSSGGTTTIQGTTVRSGTYALSIPATLSFIESKNGLNISTGYARLYLFFSNLPSVAVPFFFYSTSAHNNIAGVQLNTNGTVSIVNGTNAVPRTVLGTGTAVLAANKWNLIEFKCTPGGAGTGVAESKINETVDLTLTGQTFTNVGNIDNGTFAWDQGTISGGLFFDDMAIDNAAYCGHGHIIARQFKAGTPTYNGWTKTGGDGTIASVWNNTPFDTTKFAVSPSQTAAIAQTGLVSSFSSTQTGHGTEVLTSDDVINAIKVGAVAKASSTSNSRNLGSVRRRFAGADTDTNVTMTTGNVYYESSIFTDTLTNLNAAEAGWNRRASTTAGTQTVEDAWVIVEYAHVASDSVAEAMSLADSSTKTAAFLASLNEAMSLTDLSSRGLLLTGSTAEALSLLDAVTSGLSFTGSIAETMALGDLSSASALFAAAILESSSLSDSSSATATFMAAVIEAISAADSQSAAVEYGVTVAESIALLDAASASRSLLAALTESLVLLDSSSSTKTVLASITEVTDLVDACVGHLSTLAEVTEAFALDDSLSAGRFLQAVVQEVATLIDASMVNLVAQASVSEILLLDDVAAAWREFQASISELLTLTDDENTDRNTDVTEFINLIDSVSLIHQTFSRPIQAQGRNDRVSAVRQSIAGRSVGREVVASRNDNVGSKPNNRDIN